MSTKPILSIEDLPKASANDLTAARSSLSLRKRVLDRMRHVGKKVGMTLAEYREHVAGLGPEPCRSCAGTGKFTPPAPRTVGVVHPSQAHRCLLRNYYDVTGEIAPVEEVKWEMQVTYEIGHAIHRMVQDALVADLGAQFSPEARVEIGSLVAGNTDGDLWLPTAHAVLEIKTIGSEFANLREPKKEHQLQANGLYATALDAPFVVFLYVSKTWPYPVKEFVVDHDPLIFQRWMRAKGDKILAALESGKPPVADAEVGECADCPYGHKCPQRIVKDKGAQAFRHRTK